MNVDGFMATTTVRDARNARGSEPAGVPGPLAAMQRRSGMALVAALAAALGCGDGGPGAPDTADASHDDASRDPDPMSSDRDSGARRDGSTQAADAGPSDAGGQSTTGTVRGRVFAAGSLQALAGASVRGPRGESAVTDDEGRFTVQVPEGERVILRVDHEDHARGIEPVAVRGATVTYVEIRLAPIGARGMVDAAQGGAVRGARGMSAVVPAGALRTASGDAVTGEVEIALAALDPTRPEELRAFPGDFKATRMDASEGILETFVPMDITARRGGDELQLAAGMSMVVTFPVFDPDAAPQTIALWSLDPDTGVWREEGTASRMLDEEGNPVYRASIGHMSWWNCDAFIDQVTCIRGCVTFEGDPVPNAWVRARGIDFANEGGSFTGMDGCFAEDTKAGARLSIQAEAIEGVSEPRVVTATTARMQAADAPRACQDVGTLELAPRDLANETCPGGLVTCGTACVDLFSDPNHCGGCEIPCSGGGDDPEGGGPSGATCNEGRCECAPGESICDDRCVDTDTDREHCGGCQNACPTGQTCVAGDCEAIVCGDGLTLCGNDCVDTEIDDNHCGGCQQYCGASEGGGGTAPECVGGDCVCAGGLTMCYLDPSTETYPYCADLQTEFDDCGDCGHSCAVGQQCVAGFCEDIVCDPGLTLCGFDCVDVAADANHCGDCYQACYDISAEDGGGEGGGDTVSCQTGACECSGGLTDCETPDPLLLNCRDLTSDRDFCGSCGNRCVTGQTCESSDCTSITCAGGETLCGDECVDPMVDEFHCGACGLVCPGLTQCAAGSCGCGAGETACHGAVAGSDDPEGNTQLICAADTADCDDVPAASCADVSGDWMLDVCGMPSRTLVRQVGCAFTTDSYPYGWFTDASTVVIDIDGNRCTATVSDDTLSGTCDLDEPPCAITGIRPACTAGTELALCGGTCRDLDSDPYNCGFCFNDCGFGGVCNAGVCEQAP